jgi:hypothetical protein
MEEMKMPNENEETEDFVDDIVVTAPRLSQGGSGFSQDWSFDWYNDIRQGNDIFSFLLGTDNILFLPVEVEPEPEAPTMTPPTVDEFIDLVKVFLLDDFIGSFSLDIQYDALGVPTESTFVLVSPYDNSIDVFRIDRDGTSFDHVVRDPDDFSDIPNQINVYRDYNDQIV